MMKRIFWVGVGVSLGVMITIKINQARDNVQPTNINRAVGQVQDRVGGFLDTLSASMRERETQLRDQLGLKDPAA